MADFYTHVTTSSVLGVGYAGMGIAMGFPLETSLVAGGLCGLSGMLPDLDSDTGIPVREAMGFAAGVVPMLLVDRFQALGMPHDRMILLTAGLYFLIRFAGAGLLGRFSVHRGMFHSVPAMFIFAGLAFLICGSPSTEIRYFKAGAVLFGVFSHLLLDEIYSIEWRGGAWRFKRSFGTALKFWSKNPWANLSTYVKLLVVVLMITGEPGVMEYVESRNPGWAQRLQQVHGVQSNLFADVRGRVSGEPTSPGAAAPPQTLPNSQASPWGYSQASADGVLPIPTGSVAPIAGGLPPEEPFYPNSGTPFPQAVGRPDTSPHQQPLPR